MITNETEDFDPRKSIRESLCFLIGWIGAALLLLLAGTIIAVLVKHDPFILNVARILAVIAGVIGVLYAWMTLENPLVLDRLMLGLSFPLIVCCFGNPTHVLGLFDERTSGFIIILCMVLMVMSLVYFVRFRHKVKRCL